MAWDQLFSEPIPLPEGGRLDSLQDAGAYITRLPKAEHDVPRWQTAMHVLLQAADHGGPLEFARLGMMQALHPRPEPHYDASRKNAWRRSMRRA